MDTPAQPTALGQSREHILGIDLGTTNSLAAAWVNGETVLIPNAMGDLLTPSAVSELPDGSLMIGLAARERLGTHPTYTATAFKRWMGTSKTLDVGSHSFRAEVLSAQILSALRADAQAYLGGSVTQVVVTVPAYFNADQRHATKAAAQMAGFEHVHLLNEPTAAGLTYGLQTRQELNTFLVFDLGGGTFDVSILEYFEGVIQVRASAGDTQLGGEDFVQVMAALVSDKAGLTSAEGLLPVPEELWYAFESAKRALSSQDSVEVPLGKGEAVCITRSEFEAACEPLLKRLRAPMERALRDAQISPDELDEVVLVGGATRMPMIRHLLTRLFQKLPLRTINPDETVARGAAVYAGLLANDEALQDVVLTDVMPYTLGIITSRDRVDDVFSPIIERNTPVPVSAQKRFRAQTITQTQVNIDIRQGESPFGSDNLAVGKLTVPLGTAYEAGREFDVRFSYDINGLLEVEVMVEATGRTLNHVFQLGANQLSAAEVVSIRDNLARIKRAPRQSEESAYLLARGKRVFEETLGSDRGLIGDALLRLDRAVTQLDLRETAHAQTMLRQVLEYLDKGFRL
ncbi:Hsp70 family protein [Comamonas odontotermitis]|uniref:Hsp70 family protein n=1 Tax=Comamonas odontotermitis TaxID=379895 RepID=UPI00366D0C25